MTIANSPALSFIVFHKLNRDLSELQEELTLPKAESLILSALNLLPGYSARQSERIGNVLVRNVNFSENELEINVRDTIDSLIVVWSDYRAVSDS